MSVLVSSNSAAYPRWLDPCAADRDQNPGELIPQREMKGPWWGCCRQSAAASASAAASQSLRMDLQMQSLPQVVAAAVVPAYAWDLYNNNNNSTLSSSR